MSAGSINAEDHPEYAHAWGRISDTAERLDGVADALETLSKAGFAPDAEGEWRRASKAGVIGSGSRAFQAPQTGGEFIRAIMFARSSDAEEQATGKATLASLTHYVSNSEKASLGLTDATGGFIVPNALVDDIDKAAGYANPYRRLVTVRRNVPTGSVELPYRDSRPARAVIAPRGDTKENVNLTYSGYTATMYTLARIYDLAKQFIRQSAGAAEADVLEELGTALGLGEAYYIRQGSGTNEPYGFITALDAGPSTFRTTFTPNSTNLANSIAAAIATAAGDLAARGRRPEAAVMSATAYWTMARQGSDTAGFWLSGRNGNGDLPGIARGTLVSPWGIPVIPDDQFAADDLVVGEWSALRLYVGADARIDTSDVAGDRWDKNLVGFRGEEDIAFDARPAVYAGALQLVQDIIP